MALAPLITTPRAIQNATLASLFTSNPAYLTSLINSATDMVRRFTNRDLSSNTYSQFVDGGAYGFNGGAAMMFRQWPVTAVSRIAACPTDVLFVTNNTPSVVQRATIATDNASPLNIILTWVSSAVTSTQTISTAGLTISALAAAINAVGNGWNATADAGYLLYPASDLRPLQGAVSVTSGTALMMHTEEIQPFNSFADPEGFYFTQGWRLNDQTGELIGCFPLGRQNIWVQYTAGYATIPDAIQEATVQACQWLSQAANANLIVKSQKLGVSSVEYRDVMMLPSHVQTLLWPFRDDSRMLSYS